MPIYKFVCKCNNPEYNGSQDISYFNRFNMNYRIDFVIILAAAIFFGSCTRTVYHPVETVRTQHDTLRMVQQRTDSVYLRDSVEVVQKGDTVYKTRYRDRVRVRTLTDTLTRTVIRNDTVAVPYPVERELSRWEQTKQHYGGVAIVAVVVVLVAAVAWLAKRFRR